MPFIFKKIVPIPSPNCLFPQNTSRRRKRNNLHLSLGKKSERYRNERIASNLLFRQSEHMSTPAKFPKLGCEIKTLKTTSTQAAVIKKDNATNTANILRNSTDSATQTDPLPDCTFGNESSMSTFSDSKFLSFEAALKNNGQLDKFNKLVQALGSGKLSPTNLAWKCALDMGTLAMCSTTTNMHYDNDCVEFFSLFNLMFGASAINVLRGTAHFGSLVDKTSARGKYNPVLGSYNFPIPSVNTLKKVSSGYPSDVGVGFVGQSLDMAQEQAKSGQQFILSFDGKMVAQGCKRDCDGDVNLWGREKPTIASTLENLNVRKQCLTDINFLSEKDNIRKHRSGFKRLSLHVSRTLKQLFQRISYSFYQRQKLNRIAKENPDNIARYNTRMSFLHQNSSECESVYRVGLDVQDELLKGLGLLHGWADFPEKVVLSERPNCFQLLPPEEIENVLNLNSPENFEYVKQRSDKWHAIRKTARVTGSTLHKAIGLDMLQRQKEHHYTYVCGRSEPVPDTLLAKRLKHGTENEVNVVGTLVSKIMPAFLPPCYGYFEVGPKVVKYRAQNLILEVSADGILKCTNGLDCIYHSEHGDRKIVIEIKSPYPTDANPHVTVHKIPQRYVPQLLCECLVLGCSEGWLLIGTEASITCFRFYEDFRTLESLLNTAHDLYGEVKPCIPTKLHPSTESNKELIGKYLATHTSFFLECATCKGEYGDLIASKEYPSAYAVMPNSNLTSVIHGDVDFQVAVVTSEGEKFFNCAHNILRNQATEVVVFMLTNKDRIQTETTPYSFPVAYAMKGASMSNDDLRYMVSVVRGELSR